jgi:glucokinase
MSSPLSLGIDFGGTTVKLAVVRGSEIVSKGNVLQTQTYNSAEELIAAIAREISVLRAAFPEIAAVGVGMPGMVDAVNGIVHNLSNVRGWDGVPFRQILQEHTGLPVAVDNDAKAMAFGEWKFGVAHQWLNVICVTLGTGVGGGLILNGKLFRGSANGAGEIGQMSIDLNGAPAEYGNFGALEKYVGNRQIAERAVEIYRQNGVERSLDECMPHALEKAALSGDATAAGLWQQVGVEIGAALANIVWLLNPDCIILGGGVANAGELLFAPIRQTIAARTQAIYTKDLHIIPAALGSNAGLIGAAALGLEATA